MAYRRATLCAMSVLLLLLACSTTPPDDGPVADYRLTLEPLVPLNGNPFDGADRVDLVLDSGVGEPVRVTLELPASGDSALAESLPALDGTRVIVEGYADGELVAWGRSAPITASSGEVEARVLVVRPGEVAQLGGLLEESTHAPGVALGDGKFLLLGGATNRNSGSEWKGLDLMVAIDLEAPEPELLFETVGTLPAYIDTDGDERTARWGFTLTALSAGDAGKYLMVGGGESDGYSDASVLTAETRLFDPATLTFEEPIDDKDTLSTARTRHAAIANQSGGVLVWGGFGGADDRHFALLGDGELYDPVSRSFTNIAETTEGGEITSGSVGVALADLGSDGTLVAGGLRSVDGTSGAEWRPTDVSLRVSLRGDVEELSGMDPVAAQAMVTLPDGDVLMLGGVSGSASHTYAETTAAIDDVWRFDVSSKKWTEVGNLELARAGHRAVVLDETHVLVVGGAQTWGPLTYDDTALSCVEIYDVENDTSAMVGSCDAEDDAGGLPGRQQEPTVLVDPDWGALVLGGVDGADGVVPTVGLYTPLLAD